MSYVIKVNRDRRFEEKVTGEREIDNGVGSREGY